MKEREKEKRIAVEKEKEEIVLRLAKLEETKQELEAKLQEEIKRAKNIERELIQEREERKKVFDQLTIKSLELDNVRKDWKEFKEKHSELLKEYGRMEQKLTELERVNDFFPQTSPMEMSSSQPHAQELLLPPVEVTPLKNILGKVLVVNHEYNFIVASLGLEDGLKEGDKLSVQREGKFIGGVRVTRLFDTLSACDIVEEERGVYIQEEDVVEKI